ncbi:hypothetical protein Psta_4033 [Pirellula staleyi DSM 6068]|uniref:S-adenosyl-l-methionine hydroxide adenosyltransferase C-terminal domain-containing protein n=1 Tax=Pirellula staleyi (strain ATCC 27377 / DSM 6068 / ICPB 4128) TaxID=530564 RepID=D2R2V3_PIRSD|nr:SAM hydroxide adenosyltransferase [Pirellula staleyi]ADB18686.1 hypothetical protein Psta_4033 [Pirellula staleyi DSM 6068]
MPGKIEGTIVAFSSDGNLVSDIPNSSLAGAPRGENVLIACDEHETIGLFEPGHGQPDMTLLALLGESGFLELTIVSDSAKIMLGVSRGTPIVVKW